jgi:hypothetical protein
MPEPKKHTSNAARQRAYRSRQAAVRRAEQAAKGLPALAGISTMPSLGRWRAMKSNALQLLETLASEMQDYAGGRSEEWQESDKSQILQEALDLVEAAREAVEEIP